MDSTAYFLRIAIADLLDKPGGPSQPSRRKGNKSMFTVYTRYYHEEYLQYKNQLGDLCLFMGGVFDSPEQALEAIRADSHLIATVRTIYNFHPKSVLEFRGDGIVEQVLASEILEVT